MSMGHDGRNDQRREGREVRARQHGRPRAEARREGPPGGCSPEREEPARRHRHVAHRLDQLVEEHRARRDEQRGCRSAAGVGVPAPEEKRQPHGRCAEHRHHPVHRVRPPDAGRRRHRERQSWRVRRHDDARLEAGPVSERREAPLGERPGNDGRQRLGQHRQALQPQKGLAHVAVRVGAAGHAGALHQSDQHGDRRSCGGEPRRQPVAGVPRPAKRRPHPRAAQPAGGGDQAQSGRQQAPRLVHPQPQRTEGPVDPLRLPRRRQPVRPRMRPRPREYAMLDVARGWESRAWVIAGVRGPSAAGGCSPRRAWAEASTLPEGPSRTRTDKTPPSGRRR